MLTSLATAKQLDLLNKTGSGEDLQSKDLSCATKLRHVAAPFSLLGRAKESVGHCAAPLAPTEC